MAFDKAGTKCVTGSYDRTARIWNVEAGEEIHTLQGHENAVFSIGYNYPKWFVDNLWLNALAISYSIGSICNAIIVTK